MKETLQCTQCDAKWERTRARGRKPVVCPKCAQFNASEEQSETFSKKTVKEDLVRIDYKYPPVSYWFCSHCGQTLTVHIPIDYAPIHNCKPKRNLPIAMEKTSRQELKKITA